MVSRYLKSRPYWCLFPILFHAIIFLFFCNFHTFEILKFPLKQFFYTNYTLKFERGSTITNYFRFSLAGISIIVLYSFEFLWTSHYPYINIYIRGMTSTRPHWISKYLDYRFWKYGTSFIFMLYRERLLWSKQVGEGLFLGFVFSTWNWYDFWRRNYSGQDIYIYKIIKKEI